MTHIADKNRTKSNDGNVWQGILIEYSLDTAKYFCIWAPQAKQVVIASRSYIDKLEQEAKLLAKWPLDIVVIKRKVPTGELKPRNRP